MSFTTFAKACSSLIARLARLVGFNMLNHAPNSSSKDSSQDSSNSNNLSNDSSSQNTSNPDNSSSDTPSKDSSSKDTSSADNTSETKKSFFKCVVEPVALALAAILCFTYPVCSTLWNNRVSKEISNAYDKYNHDQAGDVRRANIRAAKLYNKTRKSKLATDPYGPDGQKDITNTPEYKRYLKALDEPMGVIGIVKIPKIGVKLPIYHGSSQKVLAHGAGHLYGTDLPVGGKNRHAVVTAHTGLADATMFDDLIYLKKGDYFYFDVQGETLRYRVFRISVVEPHDISLLQREKGRDLATLLTCTPYGVNSHRLLVTGYRVLPDPVGVPADKVQWPLWMTLFLIAMILSAAVIATMIITAVRKRRKESLERAKHVCGESLDQRLRRRMCRK